MKRKIPIEWTQLDQNIGNFIEYFGFKKNHGRIWCQLFLSKNPLSGEELCRRLKVSKTLLSFSIAELLEHDVILNVGKGARRTTYYAANPDVSGIIFNVLKKRELSMLKTIGKSFKQLKGLSARSVEEFALDPERMGELDEMIDSATSVLDAVLRAEDEGEDLCTQFKRVEEAVV